MTLLVVILAMGASALAPAQVPGSVRTAPAQLALISTSERRIEVHMRGPATLEEYCSSDGGDTEEDSIQEGEEVEADWRGMGVFYPGKVEDTHRDGTVDIAYSDGWTEERVKLKRVHVEETEEEKTEAKKGPMNDPACKLSNNTKTLKKKIADAHNEIAKWLAQRRGNRNGAGSPIVSSTGSPSAAPAPAPAAAEKNIGVIDDNANLTNATNGTRMELANATDAQKKELEELQKELRAKDERLKELRSESNDNTQALEIALKGDAAIPSSRSMSDLLNELKRKIAEREEQIEELKEKVATQDHQIEIMEASRPVTLADIQQRINALSKEADEIKKIRDRLENDDLLDDELRFRVDQILEQMEALKKKVAELLALEEKSRALAAEKAKAKSHSEQTSVAKAHAEADEALVEAAKGVEVELRKAKAGTEKMETGVHPHGEKWWRYRYEHSYVEALLMILVTILMVIWDRLYHGLRNYLYKKSSGQSFEEQEVVSLEIQWLKFFAGETCNCLLTFMTVWVLAKLDAFSLLPQVLKGSDVLHLPHSALEYRRLALDICVVLFFSIIFYFALTLAVVHATSVRLQEWAEIGDRAGMSAGGRAITRVPTQRRRRSWRTILATTTEFQALKSYFVVNISRDPEISAALGPERMKVINSDRFPFMVYLALNVKRTTEHLYKFGLLVWMAILTTFAVLMVLHRYAHMGYIRIMGFFGVQLVIIFLAMGLWIQRVNRLVKTATADDSDEETRSARETAKGRVGTRFNTESAVLLLMHYVLFFLCYGAARMICQPWMWEMHFWPVCCLTIFTIIASVVFVLVIAPMIPMFAFAMALPPNVNVDNMNNLVTALDMEREAESPRKP